MLARMLLRMLFSTLSVVSALVAGTASTSSTKRGLIYVPNSTYPQDNYVWTRTPSDLTWYYNYGYQPSSVYSNLSQDTFEFVPMLWGAPTETSDTTFLDAVKKLITGGTDITHVLTFNEPDGSSINGGSDIEPSVAAAVWVSNIIPLQEIGVQVGLPSCTGGWEGIPWLQQMLGNCSELISNDTAVTNCTYDFVPLHWYGSFEGLASHIGTYSAAFPNASFWVTEYSYDDQDLATTQNFYNQSVEYMDRLSYVDRYAYFGAFRSSASNIGTSATMLSDDGQLTDIGAWYLGRDATGVLPTSAAPRFSCCSLGWSVLLSVILSIWA